MFSLNSVSIIGQLTKDTQIKELSEGVNVANLDIEVQSNILTDTGKMIKGTTFVSVTLWRGFADIAEKYLKQRSQVFVSGELKTDSWEDQNGTTRYKTKIVANDFILITPKNGLLEALPEGISIGGGINSVEVIGNVTRTPELKTTSNGSVLTMFGVATNRKWKTKTGEEKESTEFHNIVAWGNLAESVSKHIVKGRKVYVNGRLQTRTFDAPDGTKKSMTEIIAGSVKSLGHEMPSSASQFISSEGSNAQASTEGVTDSVEREVKPDDLPF